MRGRVRNATTCTNCHDIFTNCSRLVCDMFTYCCVVQRGRDLHGYELLMTSSHISRKVCNVFMTSFRKVSDYFSTVSLGSEQGPILVGDLQPDTFRAFSSLILLITASKTRNFYCTKLGSSPN